MFFFSQLTQLVSQKIERDRVRETTKHKHKKDKERNRNMECDSMNNRGI
jgi:hypothetical protein